MNNFDSSEEKREQEEPVLLSGSQKVRFFNVDYSPKYALVTLMISLVYFIFGRGSERILECPAEVKYVRFSTNKGRSDFLQVSRQIIPKSGKCGFNYTSDEFNDFIQSAHKSFQVDAKKRTLHKVFPFQSEEDEQSVIITSFTEDDYAPLIETWPHFPVDVKYKEIKKMFF